MTTDALHAERPWHTAGGALFVPSEPWMDEALCASVDPDLWFPDKGESNRPAKRICRDCPVKELCLAFALEHDEPAGVWGGLSEMERRRLRRGRLDVWALTANIDEPIACCAIGDCRREFPTIQGLVAHRNGKHLARRAS